MRIKRDAFLYLAPRNPRSAFAQCGTCSLFYRQVERCAILGDRQITAEMSCGMYLHGEPQPQPIKSVYSAAEVGLVDRAVRCENCAYSDGAGHCNLYRVLNRRMPGVFDLDENIEARGCCNAQTPRGSQG